MRIIDFDQVTLSSLNRHAAATYADVGVSKAVVIERMIGRVAPFVSVDARIALFDAKRADELLGGRSPVCPLTWTLLRHAVCALMRPNTLWDERFALACMAGAPDFVLDCIDNVDTKVDLLMYCVQHHIPVISSMGAGAKGDPSRIQIADLSDTQGNGHGRHRARCRRAGGPHPRACGVLARRDRCPADPLSKSVRRRLKKLGIDEGIPVVYSSEMPDVGLLPLDEEQAANKDAYKTLPNFRMRILPVLGTVHTHFVPSRAPCEPSSNDPAHGAAHLQASFPPCLGTRWPRSCSTASRARPLPSSRCISRAATSCTRPSITTC